MSCQTKSLLFVSFFSTNFTPFTCGNTNYANPIGKMHVPKNVFLLSKRDWLMLKNVYFHCQATIFNRIFLHFAFKLFEWFYAIIREIKYNSITARNNQFKFIECGEKTRKKSPPKSSVYSNHESNVRECCMHLAGWLTHRHDAMRCVARFPPHTSHTHSLRKPTGQMC